MKFAPYLPQACLMGIAFTAPLQASAQQVSVTPDVSPLARKVRLSPNITTTAAIIQTVSEQTGLTIRVASYLRARKIVMQVKDISANDLLDTLAELNDWTWRGSHSGVIFIDRRKKDTPKQMADVPVALQLLMPADFRAFFGSTGRLNDPMYYEKPDAQGHLAGSAFRSGNPQGMQSAAQSWNDSLYQLLAPNLSPGFAITYFRLSDEQKHAFVVATALSKLADINSANNHNILQGTLRPYELKLVNAEITIRGKGRLMVGSTRHLPPNTTDWAGFGIDARDVLDAQGNTYPPH